MNNNLKLGKKPVKNDPRTFKLEKYLTTALPTPPATCDNTRGITSWGMLLNDTIGDCTIASCGHMIEEWTGTTPADACVLSAYEAVSGYVPGNPATDVGATCIDVLNYWRNTGICGNKITAYAVPKLNQTSIKQTVWLFSAVYLGIELPLSAQNQSTWTWESDANNGVVGSWGGHAVPVCSYSADGLTVVSWGQLYKMTWGFWDKYVSEAYAVLSSSWTPPAGFNFAQLQADLSSV